MQRRWHGLIDVIEKPDKLPVSMAWLAIPNDLASDRVGCGEQRRGAVTNVLVRDILDVAEARR